jgi:hypothetical protein
VAIKELRAWLIDRAEQYSNDSGCRAAIEDLSGQVDRGDHLDAAQSGELDDIIQRLRPMVCATCHDTHRVTVRRDGYEDLIVMDTRI